MRFLLKMHLITYHSHIRRSWSFHSFAENNLRDRQCKTLLFAHVDTCLCDKFYKMSDFSRFPNRHSGISLMGLEIYR